MQEKSAPLNPVAIELEKEEWLLGKGVVTPNTEGGKKSVSQVIRLPREWDFWFLIHPFSRKLEG